ncbi:family 1 glycosylhydrolase [Salinibacterium sp. SYSU T00001]|uniref:family 1 glycosylhydrolase n=1 Tax=Homoserinimonas sedimenticola TaxID=2986805 RepID=UPI0022354686|nr:family 1 glycosylhydrolase [Salinibacterium sedimenticola]MCW4386226.1 family 1 glycosylhydrolase [Salinibacterium sedimenticola]
MIFNEEAREFPQGFLWGAATAAHQNEGNNVLSSEWHDENRPGAPVELRSGDATDMFHRWPDDLDLLVSLGLDTFRFSLEWSRIEPAEGHISRASLAHYRAMIDGCFARGITPVVTVLHFSTPQWFAEKGGWLASSAIEDFERYVQAVAPLLRDVPWVVTINEPNLMACIPVFGEMAARGEPINGLPHPDSRYATVAIAAHRAAVDILRAHGVARVGLSLSMHEFIADEAGEQRMLEHRAALEDQFLDATAGDDFVGVQAYTCMRFGAEGLLPVPADAEQTKMGWEFWPGAVVAAVRHASERTGLAVLVTENGIATDDDGARIRYLEGALSGLRSLLVEGVDLRGYVHWTFTDNFEWMGAFAPTFGLVAVDRETFRRAPKPSAHRLGAIARTGRVGAMPGEGAPPPFPPPAFMPPKPGGHRVRPLGATVWEGVDYSLPEGYRTLTMDVYVPAPRAEPVACVVWIHGGAWLSGDRRYPPVAWPEGALFQKIVDAGMAVATIDYRHSREAAFPAQLHDAKAAVRYLRGFAQRFGIDPERIGVWGESAGGHLASLLALVDDPALEGGEGLTGPSSHLSAAVSWYGVADVTTMPKMADSPPSLPPGVELPPGVDLSEPFSAEPIDVLLADSPLPEADRRRLVSPVAHVRRDAPPFLLVHGQADGLVPAEQSQQLADALRAAGAEAELTFVPGADHVFMGADPLPLMDEAIAFLTARLAAAPAGPDHEAEPNDR